MDRTTYLVRDLTSECYPRACKGSHQRFSWTFSISWMLISILHIHSWLLEARCHWKWPVHWYFHLLSFDIQTFLKHELFEQRIFESFSFLSLIGASCGKKKTSRGRSLDILLLTDFWAHSASGSSSMLGLAFKQHSGHMNTAFVKIFILFSKLLHSSVHMLPVTSSNMLRSATEASHKRSKRWM